MIFLDQFKEENNTMYEFQTEIFIFLFVFILIYRAAGVFNIFSPLQRNESRANSYLFLWALVIWLIQASGA